MTQIGTLFSVRCKLLGVSYIHINIVSSLLLRQVLMISQNPPKCPGPGGPGAPQPGGPPGPRLPGPILSYGFLSRQRKHFFFF